MNKPKMDAKALSAAGSDGKGVNSRPSPKMIATKVASRNITGGGSTAGLHTHGAPNVRAGKKHPAKMNGGKLSAA